MSRLPSPLAHASSLLAVVAHPDDESFGLGAVLAALIGAQVRGGVLCFTAGEASSLHGGVDLADVRAAELTEAARSLGLSSTTLLQHPDGALHRVLLDQLAAEVRTEIGTVRADGLIVFDLGGVTGHPDHHRATEAAVTAARPARLPVVGWTLPLTVAEQLNAELGTGFLGRPADEVDVVLDVDRDAQRRAIACHRSQSRDNPVRWRRLELLGPHEHLRWLHRP